MVCHPRTGPHVTWPRVKRRPPTLHQDNVPRVSPWGRGPCPRAPQHPSQRRSSRGPLHGHVTSAPGVHPAPPERDSGFRNVLELPEPRSLPASSWRGQGSSQGVLCPEQQQAQARHRPGPRAARLRASPASTAPKGAWRAARPGVCTASARRGRPAPARASPASSDSASSLWPRPRCFLSMETDTTHSWGRGARTPSPSLGAAPGWSSCPTSGPWAARPHPSSGSVLQCPGTSGRHQQALETPALTALGPRRAAAAAHRDQEPRCSPGRALTPASCSRRSSSPQRCVGQGSAAAAGDHRGPTCGAGRRLGFRTTHGRPPAETLPRPPPDPARGLRAGAGLGLRTWPTPAGTNTSSFSEDAAQPPPSAGCRVGDHH